MNNISKIVEDFIRTKSIEKNQTLTQSLFDMRDFLFNNGIDLENISEEESKKIFSDSLKFDLNQENLSLKLLKATPQELNNLENEKKLIDYTF